MADSIEARIERLLDQLMNSGLSVEEEEAIKRKIEFLKTQSE